MDADRRSDVLVDAVTSVLIHLGTPNLNRACIASHVGGGSHPVPADRGISRNPRMLEPSGLRQLLAAGSFRLVFTITPRGLHPSQPRTPMVILPFKDCCPATIWLRGRADLVDRSEGPAETGWLAQGNGPCLLPAPFRGVSGFASGVAL